ncbi:hypothetical protein OIU74_008140 [Salix koriyanagi]|uniref:starch synthase n=1 Tax=Salix koriyanagi TaxID=2511006 RepID=A0A9Q0U5D0_9ROSI|nr:hypothetical protein OIU74_008140 [Salix koriyanagi]
MVLVLDIPYLNKQRLVAVEELSKANREKQLLLDKIQQSEAVNKLGNEQSLWWELLLRIDSMVLTGLIDSAEASGLRKTVMGNKFSVALVFFDIRQKTDAELLAKLRHFSDKNVFHIIQICTEMEPLVSVGSLSSYVTGLSKALQKKGYMVEVILPKYACLDLTEMQGLREIEAELMLLLNDSPPFQSIVTQEKFYQQATLSMALESLSFNLCTIHPFLIVKGYMDTQMTLNSW